MYPDAHWMFVVVVYAEYMPPEMIRGKAYNQAVDWWALGALIYEMVTGYPPFQHKNRKKLHHKILNEKVPLLQLLLVSGNEWLSYHASVQLNLPKWLSSDTHSILKQLLERNVDKRLGSGKSTMFQVKGVQAIKKHAFFRDIDWYLLAQKKVVPPIVPRVESNTDTSYFSEEFTKLAVGRPSRGERAAEEDAKLFARFSFIAEDVRSYASVVAGDAVAPAALGASDNLSQLQTQVEKVQIEAGSV